MKTQRPKAYEITRNDGRKVRVTVPENTSEKQALLDAVRDNLSPEAVVLIHAYLASASCKVATVNREVRWFADELINMVGVDEYNRMLEEIGL